MRRIPLYGQESNSTTRRLAMMNLAIRGIDADLGTEHADTFRWQYGAPPKGYANFAWVQHFVHHLAPKGKAGFVLANGSMSSNQSGEGDIRKGLIQSGLVDCMVALPGQLFYSTQIPVCLWFLNKGKTDRKDVLFIDARKMGTMTSRVHRELTDDDIRKIADTYHAWDNGSKTYEDIPGFCASADQATIEKHDFVLTPGRYVGAEELEEDDEPFDEKMKRLTANLYEQFEESARLEKEIRANLEGLGYGE